MSTTQKIVDAMRAAPDRRWTVKGLAKVAGVSAEGVASAIQSMRWAGKMEFDRLALSPSMLADVPAAKRRAIIGGAHNRFRFKVEEAGDAVAEEELEAVVEPSRPPAFHRGWAISLGSAPAPAWSATGPDDGAHAAAATLEALIDLIDLAEASKAAAPATIAEQVAAEAEEAGARRAAARTISSLPVIDRAPATIGEAVATALVEDLDDALLAAKRLWPDQWWRVVNLARQRGVRPGVVFGEVVEKGLNIAVAR